MHNIPPACLHCRKIHQWVAPLHRMPARLWVPQRHLFLP
ncbi:unnamed protein product [Leptidea sinapis]|uniref:Uncharacterized protein n=1 Tax=Leptidea sinapis TaxID=189913 RepID=A0A5E4QPJ3_9NEOP|nr:unnamed protein product [Leptidea sinapis]